jgi:hypothetical protein
MIDEGFDPDFAPELNHQLAALEIGRPSNKDGDVRDLRSLLWSSINNHTSRDLDQAEAAERVSVGIRPHRDRRCRFRRTDRVADLNSHWQAQIKRWATEIVFLESLRHIDHVGNIGRDRKSADRKNKLAAEPQIPIDRVLSAVAALGRELTGQYEVIEKPSLMASTGANTPVTMSPNLLDSPLKHFQRPSSTPIIFAEKHSMNWMWSL